MEKRGHTEAGYRNERGERKEGKPREEESSGCPFKANSGMLEKWPVGHSKDILPHSLYSEYFLLTQSYTGSCQVPLLLWGEMAGLSLCFINTLDFLKLKVTVGDRNLCLSLIGEISIRSLQKWLLFIWVNCLIIDWTFNAHLISSSDSNQNFPWCLLPRAITPLQKSIHFLIYFCFALFCFANSFINMFSLCLLPEEPSAKV